MYWSATYHDGRDNVLGFGFVIGVCLHLWLLLLLSHLAYEIFGEDYEQKVGHHNVNGDICLFLCLMLLPDLLTQIFFFCCCFGFEIYVHVMCDIFIQKWNCILNVVEFDLHCECIHSQQGNNFRLWMFHTNEHEHNTHTNLLSALFEESLNKINHGLATLKPVVNIYVLHIISHTNSF